MHEKHRGFRIFLMAVIISCLVVTLYLILTYQPVSSDKPGSVNDSTYRRTTTYEFEDDTIEGNLEVPSDPANNMSVPGPDQIPTKDESAAQGGSQSQTKGTQSPADTKK